jgi:four helix bundle protein
VYLLTRSFPEGERYGLTAQMRRAVVSIPSNLAEGYGRGSRREYRQFVCVARGSAFELETQTVIAERLGLLDEASGAGLRGRIQDVLRMLNGLVQSLTD